MPWGKFRDQPLAQVPLSYLVWCLERGYPHPALRAAIAAELTGRLKLPRRDPPPGHVPEPLRPAAREIVKAGFRAAAIKPHPDHGGTNETMRLVLEAKDALERVLG
jgi:Putative quorum-sensing-regulated virulence factor